MKARYFFALAALSALSMPAIGSAPALAEEDIGANLLIELNAAESQESGCKLSFVAINGHPTDVDEAVFEAVIFDAGGQVDRLTLLNFADLPAARPRVRQFVIPDIACDGISQILFNGASTCEATDLDTDACTHNLMLESKLDAIEVVG